MKKYKFIGNPNDYDNGEDVFQVLEGDVFNESYKPKGWMNTIEEEVEAFPEDWEEVTNKEKENTSDFEKEVIIVLDNIKELLISKNKKYGDSAINPIRVFSKASNIEQIKVRLDDKLSRLKTQHIEEDEDVLNDLIGYLVLLKIVNNG